MNSIRSKHLSLLPGTAGTGTTDFLNDIIRSVAQDRADRLNKPIYMPHPTLKGYRVVVADFDAAPSRSSSETYALYHETLHRVVGRWGLTDEGVAYIEDRDLEEELA